MHGRHTTWIALSWALAIGCSEELKIDLPNPSTTSPGTDGDSSAKVAVCDQAADGTVCGQEMHCIFNACVENACGDGIRAGSESCDDGNERNHDGCDERCRMEPPVGCGNGVIEPGEDCEDALTPRRGDCTEICTTPRCGDNIVSVGEECDDGNTSSNDRCSSRCRNIPAPCGNGMLDPNEDCDDGNTDDGDNCDSRCKFPEADGGSTRLDASAPSSDAGSQDQDSGGVGQQDSGATSDAGSSQSGTNTPQDKPACATCRDQECRVFQGLDFDFVAACLEGGDGLGGVRSGDPSFVQQCIDTMNCAYANKCGYSAAGMLQCFCGSKDASACQTAGAADGPCQRELFSAARTSQLQTLIGSFGDISLPIGVANYFLQCDQERCAACKP